MASLRDLRQRIKSVKETQKITTAMRVVAAAKYRKAQRSLEAGEPFIQAMYRVKSCFLSMPALWRQADVFLKAVDHPERPLVILMASDRGLCGGFNTHLVRTAKQYVHAHASIKQILFLPIGKKAAHAFAGYPPTPTSSRPGVTLWQDVPDSPTATLYQRCVSMATHICDAMASGRIDSVIMVASRYYSVLKQVPHAHMILPLSLEPDTQASPRPYDTEPDMETLLSHIVCHQVATHLYEGALHAHVSEQAARMMAMDGATRNAKDMMTNLALRYNRLRQSMITKELIEIISGAEALR